LTTFADPTFSATYQGLCNKIADTLNRQDLTSVIPDFTVLATTRIQRDMSRVKHPFMINRAQATVIDNYVPLPTDFVAVFQMADQDTSVSIDYISPDQSKNVMANGWGNAVGAYPPSTPTSTSMSSPIYYTILGNRIRLIPAPGQTAPETLDLWYYARLTPLNNTTPTNWVLSRYPDLYLYGSLLHSAPYLKADERIQTWEGAYQTILRDIEVEADRAVRSQTKLVAARKGF
jgi:hypothetical protein